MTLYIGYELKFFFILYAAIYDFVLLEMPFLFIAGLSLFSFFLFKDFIYGG